MSWHPDRRPWRVAVLYGGASAERSISLTSGECVAAALESAGHAAELIDPAHVELAEVPWSRFDACFVAMHGGAGEDGRIQRRLELLRVPYTGSGPAASRLAMSKSSSKERFVQSGVPTSPYVLFHGDDPIDRVAAKIAPLGCPVVIKPDSQGSSLGVGLCRSRGELASRIADSRRYEEYILAEQHVRGREFTVAVLARDALPVLEIVTPGGWFDYDAKYESVTTVYRLAGDLPREKVTELEQTAVAAAESLGTSGLVRVDMLLDRAGEPWVLEVNTVPGLTDHSLAPKAAAHAGMDMPALCEWMVLECLHTEAAR
jgi:D-alanine-D-alanine ligase